MKELTSGHYQAFVIKTQAQLERAVEKFARDFGRLPGLILVKLPYRPVKGIPVYRYPPLQTFHAWLGDELPKGAESLC